MGRHQHCEHQQGIAHSEQERPLYTVGRFLGKINSCSSLSALRMSCFKSKGRRRGAVKKDCSFELGVNVPPSNL